MLKDFIKSPKYFYLLKAFYWVSIGAMGGYWTLYFLNKGFSLSQVAIILAVIPITSIFFEIPTGAIADIYGNKTSVFISYLVTSVAFLGLLLAGNNYTLVLGMYIFAGISFTLESGAIDAWFVNNLKEIGQENKTSEYFSKWSSFSQIGFIIGPLIGAFLVRYSLFYPFLFTAVTMFILALYVLLGSDDQTHHEQANQEFKKIRLSYKIVLSQMKAGLKTTIEVKNIRILTIVATLLGMLLTISYNGYQPLIELKKIPLEYIGYALSIAGLLSTPALYLNHKIEKLFGGSKYLLTLGTALIGICFLILGIGSSLGVIVVVMIGSSFFSEFVREYSPSYRDFLNKSISNDNERATVLSINSASIKIGVLIGLLLLGLLGTSIGLQNLIIISAVGIIIFGFGYLLIKTNNSTH